MELENTPSWPNVFVKMLTHFSLEIIRGIAVFYNYFCIFVVFEASVDIWSIWDYLWVMHEVIKGFILVVVGVWRVWSLLNPDSASLFTSLEVLHGTRFDFKHPMDQLANWLIYGPLGPLLGLQKSLKISYVIYCVCKSLRENVTKILKFYIYYVGPYMIYRILGCWWHPPSKITHTVDNTHNIHEIPPRADSSSL